MGRQILTFVIVFVGIILLTRSCFAPPHPAKGVAMERPDGAGEEALVLRAASGAEARLAPDGAVAAILDAGAEVVRPVPATRRPFHVALGHTAGDVELLPAAEWKSEEVAGGRRFALERDGLKVEKTLRFAEDGRALVLDLRAEGVPKGIVGLVLTGASGADLSWDEAHPSFAFSQLAGAEPVTHSLEGLLGAREEDPGGRYTRNARVEADRRVHRCGFLGRAFYLALEDLPAVSEIFFDVYRAARDGGATEEAESWLDLVARDGAYEGTFTLRWLPRAEAPADFQASGGLRAAQTFTLEDDTFRVVFTDRGAAIREMRLKRYSTEAGVPPSPSTWVPILGPGAREGERALTLAADRYGSDPAHDVWDASPAPDGRSILFTLVTRDGWRFGKRVSLPAPGRFDLGVEIEVEAPPGASAEQAVVTLVGPSDSYIVDSYRGIIGADPPAASILERSGGSEETETIEALAKGMLDRAYAEERRGLFKAVGLRGAYFVCALVSEDARNGVTRALAKPIRLSEPVPRAKGEPSADSMLGRVSLALPLEAGRASQRFRLYAGPNETGALKELDIGESVNFGFFGFIGRGLMWLMKALQGLVGSYGIAIVLMTLIVRALLLPVSFRTQISMQRYSKRVQKIKPLLDELQKKYAKDPQRMNQERMKVMREHGVGLPLGCLTIFLQIPIWFALFQALRVEFALRHQSFLWADDLSMPDRIFPLPTFGIGFLPDWFNLLPLLMLVLWVIQQRLAPPPGSDDPQVRMQMKMMKVMPYVFFFMLYNYAAGLALYMCVSSVWSIAEAKLVRRAVARLG
jgi:YidC/Oxa1 family membrane protein insertase